MTKQQHSIIQPKNFVILDNYEKIDQKATTAQNEKELEEEFINDLINQGYEYCQNLNNQQKLLDNLRKQIENLNKIKFNNNEWQRLLNNFINSEGDNLIDRTRKFHENYIYDFILDSGEIKNIYLFDKKNIANNKLQVINQFEQKGIYKNRYDVSILINGLPVVQIELKSRGKSIKEAFNQTHRYTKESFNSKNSLFKYLQIFIISNGTNTKYFPNTLSRDRNSFNFTINWARKDNLIIKDLKDFTATFFQKNTLLKVLFNYSVFDTSNNLLVMRPYQIAATERLLWKINSCQQNNNWGKAQNGGYIWHSTGSGKTLTSFKAAQLATQLDFVDKVLFVVDRKDLDYQTMKEYQKFSPDSVSGSENTAGLKRNLAKQDNKIVITTIQKLNNLMRTEENLEIYNKNVVFIFDECHRSQFGEAQKNLGKKFKKYCQFGFTGTPIFKENALNDKTTQDVFGVLLHSYIITDAIRDKKVLKFKVDYNDVRPQFRSIEKEIDEEKLSSAEMKKAFLHPKRIEEIGRYILENFKIKTHRTNHNGKGFNAIFAVSSIDAAKLYYEQLQKLQENKENPLKIATIFSFTANEEQNSIGEILDENFEPNAMDSSSKEFLAKVLTDYNKLFSSNYSLDNFQDYYRDLSQKVKKQEIDLLIVVGIFLTGFDAPTLNTLFVDKNLRYHGLLQAFSRTNRIYDATKPFGNIVCFRNLEQATIDAITLFADDNKNNEIPTIILERSYKDYMEGYIDEKTGRKRKGYLEIIGNLQDKFSNLDEITKDDDKKEFVKLFGEYLRVENILKNYDEFTALKELHKTENNNQEVEIIKEKFALTDEDISIMSEIPIFNDREVQNYCSLYNDIRIEIKEREDSLASEKSKIDWSDVVFEVDLLKTQEIDLDYILILIFEHYKKIKNKKDLIEEIRHIIRANFGHRAKEGLIVDFITSTDLDNLAEKEDVIKSFFQYAREIQSEELDHLIQAENLNIENAKEFIKKSLRKEYVSKIGTELNSVIPNFSPLKDQDRKKMIFEKISKFVEKFRGIGGDF